MAGVSRGSRSFELFDGTIVISSTPFLSVRATVDKVEMCPILHGVIKYGVGTLCCPIFLVFFTLSGVGNGYLYAFCVCGIVVTLVQPVGPPLKDEGHDP